MTISHDTGASGSQPSRPSDEGPKKKSASSANRRKKRRRPPSGGKSGAGSSDRSKSPSGKISRSGSRRPGQKDHFRPPPATVPPPIDPADLPPIKTIGEFDDSIMSEGFRSLNLLPQLLHGVNDFGYQEPTPIQMEAIPLALEGHDLTGCAQTGTGKTAAFALPALQKMVGGSGTRVLALTPTRELAIQVSEQFVKLGKYLTTRVALVYGGVDYEPQTEALTTGADIVVATPGRLLDHMRRKTVNFRYLEILILDEADRMLDMGFAEEINDILNRLPENRQTMLFSATIPPTIQNLARKALRSPVEISISPPSTPAVGIFHGVYPISAMNKPRAVLEILKSEIAKSVLIFTRTKAGVDQLCSALERADISVARIHSDRSQHQREKALSGFRNGDHRVLVATDIVARGIDVTEISHVINFDAPEYPEDYVHRAGRTARAGLIGYAFTLMAPAEIMLVKNIERFVGKAIPRVSLPGLADDVHQTNLEQDPKPLKNQPAVARYNRRRKMTRRTGLSLR